jgi:hypothetical protein
MHGIEDHHALGDFGRLIDHLAAGGIAAPDAESCFLGRHENSDFA